MAAKKKIKKGDVVKYVLFDGTHRDARVLLDSHESGPERLDLEIDCTEKDAREDFTAFERQRGKALRLDVVPPKAKDDRHVWLSTE